MNELGGEWKLYFEFKKKINICTCLERVIKTKDNLREREKKMKERNRKEREQKEKKILNLVYEGGDEGKKKHWTA